MTRATFGKLGALVLIGVTATAISGCGGGGCHGEVDITWTVVDSNNTPITCEQAGAATVLLKMDDHVSPPFPCNAYQGRAPGLAVGTYTAALQLQDVNGNVLSQTPDMQVPINAACGATVLPQTAFEVATP
ncbi:MAG TPA: hypothetical protein VH374_23810 [Polyangia bacterium]|jgi:hypothetical protein|nr:hypothetical protein [Polyangia bacterium]